MGTQTAISSSSQEGGLPPQSPTPSSTEEADGTSMRLPQVNGEHTLALSSAPCAKKSMHKTEIKPSSEMAAIKAGKN